jgi:hypothetical protein
VAVEEMTRECRFKYEITKLQAVSFSYVPPRRVIKMNAALALKSWVLMIN